MTECGNVTSFLPALGIDVGSTHLKAAVVRAGQRRDGERGIHEIAVADRPIAGLDAAGLVDAALDAVREVLERAGSSVAIVGIASMAETGALVAPDGSPTGALLRWDRRGNAAERLALAAGLDPAALHAATGAPLVPKLPLLTWAALARDGGTHGGTGGVAGMRWAFAADLIAAALTGRIATDHTLAGRSGAYRLPASGAPLPASWDAELLDAVGVSPALLPEVLTVGERVGTVRPGRLPGAAGADVQLAGHDHAIAAWIAGVRAPGLIAHSLGTTEAVLALAPAGHPVDRARAGAEGISVVRAIDGEHEGGLAGNPAAGALIADWRARVTAQGADPDALLASAPHPADRGFALPYPRGRQCPAPDPMAGYRLVDSADDDPAAELAAILRGLAAHGAWMRSAVADLTAAGRHPPIVAVGTPVRRNDRWAGLMAALAGMPLPVVDLAAPVATGAAVLALVRAGLAEPFAPLTAPVHTVPADDDGIPDLAERFAAAVAAPLTEGTR